jgi:hypothetical protein
MVPKQFKDTDLRVFIGVASKDGGIKYHETDLSYLLSSSFQRMQRAIRNGSVYRLGRTQTRSHPIF